MKVLIIGNGSIGKQHTETVLNLGFSPIVLTNFPDSRDNVQYVSCLSEVNDVDVAIICTPTYKHIDDFINLINNTGIKKILIEKPIASCSFDAEKILILSEERDISVSVAFDMRFIPKLEYVKKHISSIKKQINLVKIQCGQFLPEWRPGTDYKNSYSSNKSMGGGVDLDLTHEIDYMLWLFGRPSSIDFIRTYNISSLEINSPDYFKAIYNYSDFVVDVELDYFRKLERKLIVLGDNKILVELDFISNTLIFDGVQIILDSDNKTLVDEDRAFLTGDKRDLLCSLNESIEVLKMINK